MNRSSGVVSAAGAARSCPLFLDLGEQPCFGRGSRPLLLRVIISKTAGRQDYGAQLGDAAATTVVEVHKRKAGPGHGILQERDRRCLRQAMLTAQMQNGADKYPPLWAANQSSTGHKARHDRNPEHHSSVITGKALLVAAPFGIHACAS